MIQSNFKRTQKKESDRMFGELHYHVNKKGPKRLFDGLSIMWGAKQILTWCVITLLSPSTILGNRQRQNDCDSRHKYKHVFFPPNQHCVHLSPGHTNAWVQIIELGGTQSDLFVLLFVSRLNLHLQQLLLTSLNLWLFPLHQADDNSQDGGNNTYNLWECFNNLWCFSL